MIAYLPKVLILGSNGQLGRALCRHPLSQNFQILAYSRDRLDITDTLSLRTALTTLQPDIIVNTAAYTDVEKAEDNIEVAMIVNYVSVEKLAMLCHQQHIPLIHLSTDYIFDGNKKSPYLEEDGSNPLNVYGKSKWAGEEAIRYHCKQHIILRLSGLFSDQGKNFVRAILKQAHIKKELSVVSDQISCPTFASDVAFAVYSMISHLSDWGTYHFCSTPGVSWFHFAEAIIKKAKHQRKLLIEEIIAISTENYPTKATRPAYSILDCHKIFKDYHLSQPLWDTKLEGVINAYL